MAAGNLSWLTPPLGSGFRGRGFLCPHPCVSPARSVGCSRAARCRSPVNLTSRSRRRAAPRCRRLHHHARALRHLVSSKPAAVAPANDRGTDHRVPDLTFGATININERYRVTMSQRSITVVHAGHFQLVDFNDQILVVRQHELLKAKLADRSGSA
jgi:hypothetical protein